MPGFLTGLERFAPPSVHLIYTFPNFKSCATIDLSPQLKYWKKVTKIPLPLRASPMQGWLDAIPYVKTKYSMLLHNDGCAAPPAPHAASPRQGGQLCGYRGGARIPAPDASPGASPRAVPPPSPIPTPAPPHPAPPVGSSRSAPN